MFMPRPRRQPYVLYGVAMLGTVVLIATFCILLFNQAFTTTVPVSMHIQRAGLQLLNGSDVKMRGLIVGSVKSINSNGDGAVIQLALNPKYIKDIPSNVDAELIPKTVFGEKYINLVTPAKPSSTHIASGAVISQDRTTPALEIDQALNDLLPLLRTVRPQDLNATLSAMASALSGRGEKLGKTTVAMDNYLKQLNPHLPQIQHDFQALAKVAQTYDQAAPALLAMLRNFTITGNTITSKSKQYSALLKQITGTAQTTQQFLAQDEQSIIQVNVVNEGTLALLAQYAPEYDCLFKGFANLLPKIKATKATKHTAAVRVEFHSPKPAYVYPLDSPEFTDTRGPNCYGLPNPPNVLPTIQFADGTQDDPRFASRNGQMADPPLPSVLDEINAPNPDGTSPTAPLTNPLSKLLGGASAATPGNPSMGDAGTAAERAWMDQILAPIVGRAADKVPAIDSLLWGPIARGTQVDIG
jgi:phospholipid/cholesterol/gamma-HCH transport system substrate-binding protein